MHWTTTSPDSISDEITFIFLFSISFSRPYLMISRPSDAFKQHSHTTFRILWIAWKSLQNTSIITKLNFYNLWVLSWRNGFANCNKYLTLLTFSTGKSLTEAFILTSINPQYDKRLFIDLSVQYMKTTNSENVVSINCSECQDTNKKQFVYRTCSELVYI